MLLINWRVQDSSADYFSFKYKIFGEYTVNLSANSSGVSQTGAAFNEASGENQAWILGGEIGVDKWKFKYAFVHFESDSTFGPLTDATFGSAISATSNANNSEGHKFGVAYKLTKNSEISATYILNEAINKGNNKNDQGELLQLNIKYKF